MVARIGTFPPPDPDSVLTADDKFSPGLTLSSHVGHHLVPSAVDHLWYLTTSITRAKQWPVFGGFTLARSTIETASTILWVLTPQDRQIRLTRHLRLEAANVNAARKMMKTQNEVGTFLGFTVQEDAPDQFVAGRRSAIEAAAGRIDLPRKTLDEAPTMTSIIKEAASEAGESPQALLDWQITSGAAHGKPWSGLLTLMPRDGWGAEARRTVDTDRSAGISKMIDTADRALAIFIRGLDRLEALGAAQEQTRVGHRQKRGAPWTSETFPSRPD